MKSVKDMVQEQRDEVARYRHLAEKVTREKLALLPSVLGVLLTGSVARGDARKGQFGLQIDITVVVTNRSAFNLDDVFGPSLEPYIPYHCVEIEGQPFAFELSTMEQLQGIRTSYEPVIFAKREAAVLFDRSGQLSRWKAEAFVLTEKQICRRALQQYFRFDYLTNDYRIEKWNHREAWVQMIQNGNEALECYCNFLYCINGWFIPRRDWLTYLTSELADKASGHEEMMKDLYKAEPTEQEVGRRASGLRKLGSWMRQYCESKGWLSRPSLSR